MCGICGIYAARTNRPIDRELVDQMCAKIVHRGPDDQGVYVDGNLGLGMRRLSIIDLDTGSQPIFNEDRSVCTVFNGELYNFRELRDDLVNKGHHFETHTDTEVIVHLYEEHGIDFVQKLNGMFAIAIWDSRRRRLTIVRDRLGVKPLYYAWTADGLVFGSEIKCLLQCDDVAREVDPEAVYHYFTLGYIPHPLSIYKPIRQLPPASRIVVQGDEITIDRYWKLQCRVDSSRSFGSVGEKLRTLLADAVRIRMISDVPLGAFLSGGLDSSIVVGLMTRESASPVRTFFIDFEEESHSERAYARAAAQHFQTEHQELTVRPSAVEVLDDLVHFFDEPFGDSSAIPTYYVCKSASEQVTVALAGDGGDEGFGGYNRYQAILRRLRLPAFLRAGVGIVGRFVHNCLPRTAAGRRFFRSLGMRHDQYFAVGTQELECREILSPEFLASVPDVSTSTFLKADFEGSDRSDPLSPYTTLDVNRYLPDDILTKVDRMSMAHSLEVRGPFLDYRVMELAASLPYDWKIQDGHKKRILRELFARDLPAQILAPRKRGFSVPMGRWLANELRHALQEAIHDPALAGAGIFRMPGIQGIAEEHLCGIRNRASQLWRFLFFAHWWHVHHTQLVPA